MRQNRRWYGYRLFKHYIRAIHNHVLYRHTYYIDKENVPEAGVPVVIVSNHQNCACDPLGLLLGMENEVHPYTLVRGDIYGKVGLVDKFFNWLGLLPTFRLNFDGEAALKKNELTLRLFKECMEEGQRVILYPEAGHQDKRWLGTFSLGYTHFAFQAAEALNFEKEIFILPSCNHYSSYFGLQEDFMVRFGKPISLKPFYELYQTKPRTAQREVNKLVRAQVEGLMLDIQDLEHYEAIDYLRGSEYGIHYAERQGLNPAYLPDKLESDKRLVKALKEAQVEDAVYDEVLALKKDYQQWGMEDHNLAKVQGWGLTLLSLVAQIALLPLWLVSLYPGVLAYNIPKLLLRTDKMFTNTLVFIVGVVLLIPIFAIATLLVMGLVWGLWWQSVVWILLFYPLSLFGWYEYKWMQRTWRNLKVLTHQKRVQALLKKQTALEEKLNHLLHI